MKLVSEVWGSRVPRYEHTVAKALGLHSKGIALLSTLMLRGPQTLGELRNHSNRLYAFDDLDDVQFALQKLAEHEPPLATALPRQPGQKEGRFAHLLCGEPELPEPREAAPPEPVEPRVERPVERELVGHPAVVALLPRAVREVHVRHEQAAEAGQL